MFKCYDSIKLPNNILKCDQCKEPFNAYNQPRFLSCSETICSTCVVKIEKEALNHFIPWAWCCFLIIFCSLNLLI